MKRIYCPKGHGKMQRMYMRNNKGWHISKYWMCPVCQTPYTEEILQSMTNIDKVEVEYNEIDDERLDLNIKLDIPTFERFLRRKKTPDETDIIVINRILDGDIKEQPR